MHTQSLNDNWQFREAGTDEWLPAQVSGSVHTDLLARSAFPIPSSTLRLTVPDGSVQVCRP